MAITNTRTVQRCEVYPAQEGDDPTIMVVYNHTFDDSTDDALPVTTNLIKHLSRYEPLPMDAEEGAERTATDVTGEDQMVQDICAALWTD